MSSDITGRETSRPLGTEHQESDCPVVIKPKSFFPPANPKKVHMPSSAGSSSSDVSTMNTGTPPTDPIQKEEQLQPVATWLLPEQSENGTPGELEVEHQPAPLHEDAIVPSATEVAGRLEQSEQKVWIIDVDLIDPPLVQQRFVYEESAIQKVANSMLASGNGDPLKGQLTPVLIHRHEEIEGRYRMIEGFTRLKALKNFLRKDKIKAIIVDCDIGAAYLNGMRSNIHRNEVTPYDLALSFKQALTAKYFANQQDIADKLGLARNYVSNVMAFNDLPLEVQQIIEANPTVFGYTYAQRLRGAYDKFRDDEALVAKLVSIVQKVSDNVISSRSELESALEKIVPVTRKRATGNNLRVLSLGEHGTFKFDKATISCNLNNLTPSQVSYLENGIKELIQQLQEGPSAQASDE